MKKWYCIKKRSIWYWLFEARLIDWFSSPRVLIGSRRVLRCRRPRTDAKLDSTAATGTFYRRRTLVPMPPWFEIPKRRLSLQSVARLEVFLWHVLIEVSLPKVGGLSQIVKAQLFKSRQSATSPLHGNWPSMAGQENSANCRGSDQIPRTLATRW